MSSKFNKYIFYIDSTRQTVNFDSLDEVNEYVCDITGVSQNQVVIVDNVEEKGHSNVTVKDKFGDQMRVVGFVYGSRW